MLLRVLLAALQPELLRRIREALETSGSSILISETDSLERVRALTNGSPYDLLVLSDRLLGPTPFLVLEELGQLPDPPAILIATSSAGAEARTDYLAAGALAVLEMEAGEESLGGALEAILERHRARISAEAQVDDLAPDSRFGDFATRSPRMKEFLTTVRKVVDSAVSVLLLGETGAGKEFLAQAIHNEGPRKDRPFIAINCAAVPESLIETELFGHAKGAFTGAVGVRRGYFELAHGGTLFLDEIGDLPLHLQSRLLRVLEERRIRPIGDEKTIDVDVRVIAATNRDIKKEVAEGRFREDLYYRLGAVALTVPPLRERREDIPALVESQVEHLASQMGRRVFRVRPEALDVLMRYAWPGNVRELINVVERAVLLTDDEEIGLDDLPDDLTRAARGNEAPLAEVLTPQALPHSLTSKTFLRARDELLEDFERRYFDALLRETRGRIGEAAKRAGITPRSLYDKMKKLGLRKEAFRQRPAHQPAE